MLSSLYNTSGVDVCTTTHYLFYVKNVTQSSLYLGVSLQYVTYVDVEQAQEAEQQAVARETPAEVRVQEAQKESSRGRATSGYQENVLLRWSRC